MSDLNKLNLEGMNSLSLQDLKALKPAELIQFAEEVGVENACLLYTSPSPRD